MIIFCNFAQATEFDTLMILSIYNISNPLTCPKTWGKGPKLLRSKVLKLELFHKFEHAYLPNKMTKQIKIYWARNYK